MASEGVLNDALQPVLVELDDNDDMEDTIFCDDEEECVGDSGAVSLETEVIFLDNDDNDDIIFCGDDNRTTKNGEESSDEIEIIGEKQAGNDTLSNGAYPIDYEEIEQSASTSSSYPAVFHGTSLKSITKSQTNLRINCLDIYRCFICGRDYEEYKSFLKHRIRHKSKPLKLEHENPFECGVCGRPWDMPRKALACAIYGHDPTPISAAMFCHNCPLCPEDALGYLSLGAVSRHWASAHPKNPMPGFFLKAREQKEIPLPRIVLTQEQIQKVTLSMLCSDNQPLVLGNPLVPISYSTPKRIVASCKSCKAPLTSNFDAVGNQCSNPDCQLQKPTSPEKWRCPHCNSKFLNSNYLKAHLTTSGCNFADNVFVFKCVFCEIRFKSCSDLKMHRQSAHPKFPFNIKKELPFACVICDKPAVSMKQALICALFGHNPESLQKVMFKYKCETCPEKALGFHSQQSLFKHIKTEHPSLYIPTGLISKNTENSELPKVKITVQQVMSLRNCEHSLSKYVKEIPTSTHLLKCQRLEWITKRSINSKSEKIGTKFCNLCGHSYNDFDRHMRIRHKSFIYCGIPKYKCRFCNKEYYLHTSYYSHRIRSSSCKLLYLKFGDKIKTKTQSSSSTANTKTLLTDDKSVHYDHSNTSLKETQIVISSITSLRNAKETVEEHSELTNSYKVPEDDDDMIEISEVMPARVKYEPEEEIVSYPDCSKNEAQIDKIYSMQTKQEPVAEIDGDYSQEQLKLMLYSGCESNKEVYNEAKFSDDNTQENHSNEVIHECFVCLKVYDHEESLKSHLKCHTKQYDVSTCNVCQKTYSNQWNMMRHRKSHFKYKRNFNYTSSRVDKKIKPRTSTVIKAKVSSSSSKGSIICVKSQSGVTVNINDKERVQSVLGKKSPQINLLRIDPEMPILDKYD